MPNYGFQWPQQRKYNPYQIGGGQGFGFNSGGGGMPQTSAMPGWVPWAGLGGTVLGAGMELFGGGAKPKYNVPNELPPEYLEAWRRMNRLTNMGALTTQRQGVRRNAARMGLGNTGFINSMENPAFQTFGMNELMGENQINQAKIESWLRLQQIKMEQDIARMQAKSQQGGWGDLLSGAASTLPFMFL